MRFAATISLLACLPFTPGCSYPKVDHQFQVVDSETGVPIKDACASISYGGGHTSIVPPFGASPKPQARTRRTDANGMVMLPIVETWRHGFNLNVRSPGYDAGHLKIDWLAQGRRLESGAKLELPVVFKLARLDTEPIKSDSQNQEVGE